MLSAVCGLFCHEQRQRRVDVWRRQRRRRGRGVPHLLGRSDRGSDVPCHGTSHQRICMHHRSHPRSANPAEFRRLFLGVARGMFAFHARVHQRERARHKLQVVV